MPSWPNILACRTTSPARRTPDKHTVDDIVIEMRDPEQVLNYRGIRTTIDGVKAIYPAFDITPPHLISGVVTDKGVYVPYVLDSYFDSEHSRDSFLV